MNALRLNLPFGAAPSVPSFVKNEAALNKSALAKARRLAKKHHLEIAFDHSGYWVNGPFDDTQNDPICGEHFCADGREVLEKVALYIAALNESQA